MVKLTNPAGGVTWVHESRIDEYKARGFKEAPPPTPPEPRPVTKKPPAQKPKKST